jgi:hypothetical protein
MPSPAPEAKKRKGRIQKAKCKKNKQIKNK